MTPLLLNDFKSRLEIKVTKMFEQSFRHWVTLGDMHRKQ